MISGYLGDDDTFDHAIAEFAEAYADVTEIDHARLAAAIDAGELDSAARAVSKTGDGCRSTS